MTTLNVVLTVSAIGLLGYLILKPKKENPQVGGTDHMGMPIYYNDPLQPETSNLVSKNAFNNRILGGGSGSCNCGGNPNVIIECDNRFTCSACCGLLNSAKKSSPSYY